MTIGDLLAIDSEPLIVEEFFPMLYAQNIHPAFTAFGQLPINYDALDGVRVYEFEHDGDIYYKLCFGYETAVLYQFNTMNMCTFAWCIDAEVYRLVLDSCVKAVSEKYIPVYDIGHRIS
jgi:hypothetical protein